MAGAAKKWLTGCGIGCGLLLVLSLGAGTIGYIGVRKAMDRGEGIEEGFDRLRAEYGGPAEYVPGPDGSVPTGRMEVFLAARRSMAEERKTAGDVLRVLDGQEVDGGQPNFIQKAKAGIQLIPAMMTFIEQRNDVLLTEGIGLGEYLYIYSLSYFNLLDKDLTDGPSFTLTSDDEDNDNRGFQWNAGPQGEKGDTREDRERTIRKYLHRIQLKMARNQLQNLDARGGSAEDRERLEAEIALMEAEPLRLLWETGMPDVLRRSLEPYLDELDATYDPMINVLESGLVENE
jgi:hypothetical protein